MGETSARFCSTDNVHRHIGIRAGYDPSSHSRSCPCVLKDLSICRASITQVSYYICKDLNLRCDYNQASWETYQGVWRIFVRKFYSLLACWKIYFLENAISFKKKCVLTCMLVSQDSSGLSVYSSLLAWWLVGPFCSTLPKSQGAPRCLGQDRLPPISQVCKV